MTHLKIPVGNFPSFEADYVRLFPRLRARGTPPGAFPRLVLKPAQGKKIYLNYGLGDRSSILVTRNILSSSCYLDSSFNSLWLLSSDSKGYVSWGIVAKPEAGHTPPTNIDSMNTAH